MKRAPTPREIAGCNHMESPSFLTGTAKAWSLTMSSTWRNGAAVSVTTVLNLELS